MNSYRVGDLVHIPEAVRLLRGDVENQLLIPFEVSQTKRPEVGVVTGVSQNGYLQVYCGIGRRWVLDNTVYKI